MIWKFGRLPSTSINLPRRISTTHGNIGDCWMGCWVCLRYHHQEETLVHDCEAAMFVTVSWYQNRHGSYTVSKSSTISNAFLTKTIPQSKVSNEKQQNPHSKLFPGNWWFIMEILFLKNHQFLEVYKSSIQVFKIIQIPDVFSRKFPWKQQQRRPVLSMLPRFISEITGVEHQNSWLCC